MPPWPVLRLQDNNIEYTKHLMHFPFCACHPWAGAMLIFSVSFQFDRMFPEGNPHRLAENEVTTLLGILQSYPRQSVQILVFDPRFFQTQLGIECFPPCPLPSLLLEALFALSWYMATSLCLSSPHGHTLAEVMQPAFAKQFHACSKMPTPGFEPRLPRPQGDVLTTRRCGPPPLWTSLLQ